MRIAYFDCPAGASGDMILGALVDAGCPLAAVEAAVRALEVPGWALTARPAERGGFAGTQVVVETDPAVHFQSLAELLAPIERSALPVTVKTRAGAILARLAEAEGRVHRVAPTAVHFHEVGALDTLIDVVGAVAGLETMGIATVCVSPLPLGGGTVETAHGRLPVPAPATVELLRGFSVYDNGIRAELVTPTGAAVLTTLGTPGRAPVMTLTGIGSGAGSRELPIPNLLRVLVGDVAGPERPASELPAGVERDTVVQLETAVDDMSPQLYEAVIDRLLEAGALDVYLTPVTMKRSRPGVAVTVLAPPARAASLMTLLFRETTTIGMRVVTLERARLARELRPVDTPFGPVTVKVSRLGTEAVTVTPEFEEVRRIARERGLPVREVLERVRTAAQGAQIMPPVQPESVSDRQANTR